MSVDVSTHRRRFPTELVLALTGIGLGVTGALSPSGGVAGLLWPPGGALVFLGMYFGILASFVGVLERRARAAEGLSLGVGAPGWSVGATGSTGDIGTGLGVDGTCASGLSSVSSWNWRFRRRSL